MQSVNIEKELKFHIHGIGQFADIYLAVKKIPEIELAQGPFLRYSDLYFEDGDDHFRIRSFFNNSDKIVLTRKSKATMQDGFMIRSETEKDISPNEYYKILYDNHPVLTFTCSRQIIHILSIKNDVLIAEMSLDTVETIDRMEQFVEIELKEDNGSFIMDAIGLDLSVNFKDLITSKSKKQIFMEE